MKILYLTLTKEWFDLIVSGVKTVEYREIKPYWAKRLLNKDGTPKHFDAVHFRNGYGRSNPNALLEYQGLGVGRGRVEWGAPPDKDVFNLNLGEVLNVDYGKGNANGITKHHSVARGNQ
ncbi:ASCH domain-containing protein [Methylophilus sp. QUAN]|uniref:ASCH domain-containing protein n=1 Tax=Methylophilus sp. QUAN TaxID=2781020 RepID=UPI00188E9A28|nr:ASCH domain-containing protein [Methylophilus sp. QUAN]MBF4991074.1 ASCH domain-containing protein [Methylophilus sp. QUAN]